jgi:predicted nucleic acid-binding Zn finger protein
VGVGGGELCIAPELKKQNFTHNKHHIFLRVGLGNDYFLFLFYFLLPNFIFSIDLKDTKILK